MRPTAAEDLKLTVYSEPMYRFGHGSNYGHESLAILPVKALKDCGPAGIRLSERIGRR
jgi:hypothetical protein